MKGSPFMLCLRAIYNIILHIQYNPIRQHEQQKGNRNNIVCLLPLMYCFCCPFVVQCCIKLLL